MAVASVVFDRTVLARGKSKRSATGVRAGERHERRARVCLAHTFASRTPLHREARSARGAHAVGVILTANIGDASRHSSVAVSRRAPWRVLRWRHAIERGPAQGTPSERAARGPGPHVDYTRC